MILWTCIARCGQCGREINRAEHVPENKKQWVSMTAAFNARCDEPHHNTFSDLNLRYTLDWVEEPPTESDAQG